MEDHSTKSANIKYIGDQAANRLSDTTSYWRHYSPTATHIFKVAMTYTTRFDPDGRGTPEDQDQWGFRSLTWGDGKAKIDIDIRTKPWVSSVFLKFADVQPIHAFPTFFASFSLHTARFICSNSDSIVLHP